jgi:hypothetical protein
MPELPFVATNVKNNVDLSGLKESNKPWSSTANVIADLPKATLHKFLYALDRHCTSYLAMGPVFTMRSEKGPSN